jgi:hypothetical protein
MAQMNTPSSYLPNFFPIEAQDGGRVLLRLFAPTLILPRGGGGNKEATRVMNLRRLFDIFDFRGNENVSSHIVGLGLTAYASGWAS